MFKNVKEALKYCTENDVKIIDFKMIDLNGGWRHLSIPVARLTEDTMKYGIGFDGSNYGYAPIEKSDMVFIPDLATAHEDPFCEIKTLSMCGNVYVIKEKDDNIPFDQYPRNVSLRAEEYMVKSGIADTMIVGPEFEFYLFDHVAYEVKPEVVAYEIDADCASWNSGASEYSNLGITVPDKGGYHIAAPLDSGFDLRSKMSLLLEDWGVPVKYHHPEVGGPGQMEIEVELGAMTEMADRTMITKYVIRNAAVAEGRTATFMPKPIYKEAGSGMHVHMLLKKNGKSVFYDAKGYAGLSKTAHYFMGGLLEHAASLCGILNPSTNSFKRLVPGYEAPVTVGYATSNRSAVIRIPAYAKSSETKRFELRNPDATCNPYYAYAAILMAGLDGVEKKIDPAARGWGPFDFNLFTLSDEEKKKLTGLPTTLDEALDALEADHDYLTKDGVFPEALLNVWIKNKRAEAREINNIPHPAEIAKYYNM